MHGCFVPSACLRSQVTGQRTTCVSSVLHCQCQVSSQNFTNVPLMSLRCWIVTASTEQAELMQTKDTSKHWIYYVRLRMQWSQCQLCLWDAFDCSCFPQGLCRMDWRCPSLEHVCRDGDQQWKSPSLAESCSVGPAGDACHRSSVSVARCTGDAGQRSTVSVCSWKQPALAEDDLMRMVSAVAGAAACWKRPLLTSDAPSASKRGCLQKASFGLEQLQMLKTVAPREKPLNKYEQDGMSAARIEAILPTWLQMQEKLCSAA